MFIIVTLSDDQQEKFIYTTDYRTDQEGELDVLADNGYVVATFAKGMWKSVRRFKDYDEEWPDPETQVGQLDQPLQFDEPMFDYLPKTKIETPSNQTTERDSYVRKIMGE